MKMQQTNKMINKILEVLEPYEHFSKYYAAAKIYGYDRHGTVRMSERQINTYKRAFDELVTIGKIEMVGVTNFAYRLKQ